MKLQGIHVAMLAIFGGVMLCSLMACEKKSESARNHVCGGIGIQSSGFNASGGTSMNAIIRYGSILMLGMAAFLPARAMASDTVSPSDVEINFQDLYVLTSPNCSNPKHVLHNSSTATQNFIQSPTLGSGSVPKGTYPCAIVGINSIITLTPATNSTSSSPSECKTTQAITNRTLPKRRLFCEPGDGRHDYLRHWDADRSLWLLQHNGSEQQQRRRSFA